MMAAAVTDEQVRAFEALPALPSKDSTGSVPEFAALRHDTFEELTITAKDDTITYHTWIKSPKLDINIVRRIKCLQLFAQVQETVPSVDREAGQWAWAELIVLKNDGSDQVEVRNGLKLAWSCLDWNLPQTTLSWGHPGRAFGADHDFLRYVEDGDSIGVRLCVKYSGHALTVAKGYLVFDLSRSPSPRDSINTGEVGERINRIQNTFDIANALTKAPYRTSISNDVRRVDQLGAADARPLRVLALDGGGVRGLASLHMLKAILAKMKTTKKPCEIFDMIAGTSSGGLLAIMLGRLNMSVDDCIAAWPKLMEKIFDKSYLQQGLNMLKTGAKYEASDIEAAIKEIISKALPGTDPANLALLKDGAKSECLMFCLTMFRDAVNNRAPVALRSYQNPVEKSLVPSIKVWEAARATTAAPTYFEAITVDGYRFIDGGLEADDPLGWLWTEVLGVFGPVRSTDCVLSLGTGIPSNVSLDGLYQLATAMDNVATNKELTNVLFRTLIDAYAPKPLQKKYFRVDVGIKVPGKGPTEKLGDYAPIPTLDDYQAIPKFIEDEIKPGIEAQGPLLDEIAKALLANLHDTSPQMPVNTPSPPTHVINVGK